jgi:hypothetical protein
LSETKPCPRCKGAGHVAVHPPGTRGPRRIDIAGQRFGRLLVTRFSHTAMSGGHKTAYWHCECDCGNKHVAPYGALKRGKSQSCGCLKKEVNSLGATFRAETRKAGWGRYWDLKRAAANKGGV